MFVLVDNHVLRVEGLSANKKQVRLRIEGLNFQVTPATRASRLD